VELPIISFYKFPLAGAEMRQILGYETPDTGDETKHESLIVG